jgi:hypothetical protein
VETGPSVVTATKILPRFADETLLYPNTANDEYLDGATGTDDLMYCVPYNARYVLEIDESGDVDDNGDPVATSRPLESTDLGTSGGKYSVAIAYTGGTTNTNGIYGIPYNAGKLLYIDTTVSPATIHEITLAALSGSGMFRSAQLVGSAVYCIPYNSARVVKITLNGTTSTAATIGGVDIPGTQKFATSAFVKNRWIVAAPYDAGSFLVIDTDDDSVALKYSTGGYFEVPSRGRGYTLGADRTVETDATQNGGTNAQGTVQIDASQILTAVTVDDDVDTNYGYYSTPQVRVNTGTHTYRAPRVSLNMTDDGSGRGTTKVDTITIDDAGDNVEGCTISLLGGFGENARARAYVTINPTTGVGEVAYVSVIDPGSGYLDANDITVTVSGGRLSNGTDAVLRVDELYPISEGGGIKLISVVSGGSRYIRNPTVTISGGKGVGASLTTHLKTDGHLHFNVDTPGSGFGSGFNELTDSGLTAQAFFDAYVQGKESGTPFGIIQIEDPYDATDTDAEGVVHRGNNAGATGGATGIGSYPAACVYIKNTNASGEITELGVISAGSGYITAPQITYNLPGGATAPQITATLVQDGKLNWYPTTTDDGTGFTDGYVASSLTSTRDPVYTDESVIPGSPGTLQFILEGEIPDPATGDPIQYIYKTNRINRLHGEGKFQAMVYDTVAQRIYVAPWNTHRVLSLQTDTNDMANPEQIKGGMGTGGGKYSDITIDTPLLGVGQNPVAYGIPYNYRYVLTMTNATSCDYIRSPNGVIRRFDGQWNAGVLAQGSGIIYGVPASENSLLMIDAKRDSNGTLLNTLSTLEFFGNIRARGNKFSGAIIAPSTSLYFIPKYAPFVVELNPGTSTLRGSALPDTIVFPTDSTLDPIQPKSFGYDITFSDGVELPNGNVVFVPTYNISDPFAYEGKVLEVDPVNDTHTLHSTPIPFTQTPPFPSRSSVVLTSGNTAYVAWVPRAHPDQKALMRWDISTRQLSSVGDRDLNQAEVRYSTQIQNPDDTKQSVGTIPTNTIISQAQQLDANNAVEEDFFPMIEENGELVPVYFNQDNVWRFADAVVDPYDRLFFIPATVSKTSTKIYIGYPRPPWPTTIKPSGVQFSLDSSFPLQGTQKDSNTLTYPTEIPIRETFWGTWGPPPPRYSGDEVAIAFGGAAFCGTDQRMYAVPFNALTGMVVDPVYHEVEALGSFSTYTDTPITRTETLRNGDTRAYAQQMYRGCVEGANAKIYGIPYGANHVCEIDPTVADAGVRSTMIDTTVSSLLPSGDDGFFYQLVDGYFETTPDPLGYFTNGQQELIRTGYTTNLSSLSAATGGGTEELTYSTILTGTFEAPATGTYTFATTSDDASYLWVLPASSTVQKTILPGQAGSPLVDNGGVHASATVSDTIALNAGEFYTVTIAYGNNGGSAAALSVSVTLPDTTVLNSDWSSVISAPPGGQNYNAKWWGGIRARNNKIYCVPYDADCVLVISPGEGTTPTSITIPNTLQGIGSRGGNKWANAVVAENGNIYCCPVNADTILKIVPGLNGDQDQYALIPFFGGSAKTWGGVYSPSDGYIYFFPGFQNGTVIRFDPESETYDRVGDLFGSGDYRFPGRWTTRPAVLTNGDAYVFPGRGVSTALRLSSGQDRIFRVDISQTENVYALGPSIQQQFKLRPFTIEYPEEQQKQLVFYNDDGYAFLPSDPPTSVRDTVSMVRGPSISNGVVIPLTDSSFASLFRATLNIVDAFKGGIAGVVSPTNRADLAQTVAEPSLITFHASDEIEVRNIWRTVFGKARMGIIGSFASPYNDSDSSKNAIVSYVREAAVLETRGHTVSGPVDGFVAVGTVQGFQDRQVTCPLVSSIISTDDVSASSTAAGTNVTNLVDTNVASIWQSGAATYDTETGDNVSSASYIDVTSAVPFRLGRFAITPAADDLSSMPNAITVLVKENTGDPSFTTLQTFTGIEKTEYTKYERKTFEIDTCGFNRVYRFQIDKVFPGSTVTQFSQLVLDGTQEATDALDNPVTVPKITSQFSGHISEVLIVTQSDQRDRGYAADQTFYYTFSRASAFTDENVTR